MGSPVAPSVANLFMDKLEREHILEPSNNPFFEHIIFWKRYIDDIFCLFEDVHRFSAFLSWLNSVHSTIKFEPNIQTKEIPFLDTVIYTNTSGELGVRVYHKPTDKNSYLHFKSAHPHHLRMNLPYSQFLRAKRNSSHPRDFKETNRMVVQFLNRGYSMPVIRSAQNKAICKPREELLAARTSAPVREKRITCGFNFSRAAYGVKRILLRHWHLISHIPGCDKPPLIGFRRGPNIKQMLIQTDINPLVQVAPPLSRDIILVEIVPHAP